MKTREQGGESGGGPEQKSLEEDEQKNPEKELPTGFRSKYPLVYEKLDSPEKVSIFLQAAEHCEVQPMELAFIAEKIIEDHETRGLDYVTLEDEKRRGVYENPRLSGVKEVLSYYTSSRAEAIRELLFPGLKNSGFKKGFFFDWRNRDNNEGEK
ncbi:hypothetical protein KKB41_02120 [Patescibacteria group bacterium]|nr:hypothetical protein [Patescibacteria group bacterium]